MIRSKTALVGIFIILIVVRQANADGCFFREIEVGRSSPLVASPKQEAILATDGSMVQAVLRTHFLAGPQELAWVVPVPAKPENIKKADDSVFSKLEEITTPKFYKRLASDNGLNLHFGCGASSGQQISVTPLPVRIEEAGAAGIFDYTVLAAEDPAALTKWLNDNKYHLPDGAEPVLKHYVERRWYWLAMRVRPEADKQGTLAPHPISYTYQSNELIFPLVISRLSAARENEIVLYVVGPSRFWCSNWSNMVFWDFEEGHQIQEVAQTAVKGDAPRSGTNYEELVRQETGRKKGHLFVTEFSQPWELFGYSAGRGRRLDDIIDARLIDSLAGCQTLTRLRAYVLAESMNQDIALAAAKDSRPVKNSAHVANISAGPTPAAALALVPVILVLPCGAFVMPYHRRSSRFIRRACFVLTCVAILVA